jgi:predicted RNase H-like nuclease (RuvC/YqgF family)
MNRIFLIINTAVLALLLAVGTPLAFQVMSLRGQVRTLQSERDQLAERIGKRAVRSLNDMGKRLKNLDQRIGNKPTKQHIQKALDDQRQALESKIRSVKTEASTARTDLRETVFQLETNMSTLQDKYGAAEEVRRNLKQELAAIRRQVSGEAVDITGEWTLHNQPTPNELPVTISRVQDNQFRLASGHNAHGIYKLEKGQLEMVKFGSEQYTDFVWKVISADRLKLLTTQYAGSTLVRKDGQQ